MICDGDTIFCLLDRQVVCSLHHSSPSNHNFLYDANFLCILNCKLIYKANSIFKVAFLGGEKVSKCPQLSLFWRNSAIKLPIFLLFS
jgi:hypothetical protein